ncbi:helix-turn-helix domain-containing protein [Mesorhizobium sp. 128a]
MSPDDFKAWRHSMNWTQQDAADALHLSHGTIENYERGKRREDNRPVDIPFTVAFTCAAYAIVAAEGEGTFLHRLTSTSVRDGLPTEGEAERARAIEAREFAQEVYSRLLK